MEHIHTILNIFILLIIMNTDILKDILEKQQTYFNRLDSGVTRTIKTKIIHFLSLNINKSVIITGIRRSGKSTLLRQIANDFKERYVYVGFDDERLTPFKQSDYENLLVAINMINPHVKLLLFDEIQNMPDWNKFIN